LSKALAAVLVLASSSPYRRNLLERLRLPFEVAAPHVDERPHMAEAPSDTAIRLAEAKARAVATYRGNDLIIGSDQVASLEGVRLGKPGGYDAALEQLRAMRGRTVEFHTAVCLLNAASGAADIANVPTTVQFRAFTDQQAKQYLEIDRPYDCAGSAKIEALGIALVERVESTDPSALIGLPLIALITLLKRAGIEVL
jgi:septum formation protein